MVSNLKHMFTLRHPFAHSGRSSSHLRYLVCLALSALLAAAFTIVSYSLTVDENNYITEVNVYTTIGYNSSTDFDVEFSYDDEDERIYIESSEINELESTSTKVLRYRLTFNANTGNGFLFAEGEALKVNVTNVTTLANVNVTNSGRKLSIDVFIRYKSTGTRSSTAATASSDTGPEVAESTEGWTGSGTSWYYLKADGNRYYGWINDGTGWYYCNPAKKGKMQTGWLIDSDGYRYYLDPSTDNLVGKMLTGWVTIGEDKYYLNPEEGGPLGAAVVSTTITIDGEEYSFDFSGKLVS